MGGSRSGRWGGKATIGRTRSYELSTQALKESLRLRYTGIRIVFSSDWDEVIVEGIVDATGSAPRIVLAHKSRCEPRLIDRYTISLDRTYPYRGGVRWWFRCPQTGRRAAKLYLPLGGRRFLSREAYGLVHDTRQMSRVGLLSNRVKRIAAKLGEPGHHFFGPPEKPPRMRWLTYDRLVDRWHHARDAYWDVL
jgi:hypothetical protein